MSDVHVAAIRALEAGKGYRAVGKEFGFHWQSVRRLLLKYQRYGIERIQAIKLHPMAGTSSMTPDDEYNRKWLERLTARSTTNEKGCFVWMGPVMTKGYPAHAHRKWRAGAHRIAYMITHGIQLRKDQFVCHSCDEPRCWNPEHLWIGTNGENQRDAGLKGRHQESKKTHCPQGHEYSPENTYVHEVRPGTWSRNCLACQKIRSSSEKYKAKARERQRLRRRQKTSQVSL